MFDYPSEITNLPAWATGFARELRRDGDDYTVVTGLGEFFLAITADHASGAIDMFAGSHQGADGDFPSRAVALPDGRTAYSLAMFQGPRHARRAVEAQHASLQGEFRNIEQAFG